MNQSNRDPKQLRSAAQGLGFRLMAVALVLYWLYDIVRSYLAGGPDAPSTTLLILAIILMGGGSVFLAVISLILWNRQRKQAQLPEEPEPEE